MKKAILELGGNINRLDTALDLAKKSPNALIIISSESDPKECLQKLKAAGIAKERFILDYNAWDTVTNFVKTLPIIKNEEIDELYVVTDLFHIQRSRIICESVYFNTGVKTYYIPHGTDDHKESIWYDMFRSIFWRFTGYLWYEPNVKNARMSQIEADGRLAKELLQNYEL